MRLRQASAVALTTLTEEVPRKRRALRPLAPVETTAVEESPLRDALIAYLESLP